MQPKCNARLHLQVSFPSIERKDLFSVHLKRAKQRLFPVEGGNVDNYRILSDCLEGREIGRIKSVEDNASEDATFFLDSSSYHILISLDVTIK